MSKSGSPGYRSWYSTFTSVWQSRLAPLLFSTNATMRKYGDAYEKKGCTHKKCNLSLSVKPHDCVMIVRTFEMPKLAWHNAH